MNIVKYLNPDGKEVSVPEADAAWFDAQGWPRAEGEAPKKKAAKKAEEQQ